jgi:threonylcarbamoyladenosine tRNA methylthiotransferase MtaB
MRIAFTTLGCKINQYETDQLRKELASQGNTIVPFGEQADVYIINTCSVTAKSDYQCRQAIRSAARRGEGAKVIVTGCYATTRPDELRKMPGVQWVVKNEDKRTIPVRLMESVRAVPPAADSGSSPGSGKRTRGFLKIQDGCDNRCSYCIVPDARGRTRSMATADVIREFDRLVAAACPEIVLTGIHVGMYGSDLEAGASLTGLIRSLLLRRGASRIRLSSIEPNEITEALITFLGNGVCRHLHIPLQSGNDRILAAMRRKYTSSFYKDLLNRIAENVPDIALGADIIVGFPGEGEREFEQTLDLVHNSPLTHLHVFSYSPRPGTPAASMPGQVPETVKKRRSEVLRLVGERKNLDFRKRFVGRDLQVVIEDKKTGNSDLFSGLTDNYIRVSVSGAGTDHIGKELQVRIQNISEKVNLGTIL